MTDELATAVREWLRFDNEVEPPNDDQSYDELVAYERAKMEITERVAAALEERDAVREALEALRHHPMFEGEGVIPKANVRFVIDGALDENP